MARFSGSGGGDGTPGPQGPPGEPADLVVPTAIKDSNDEDFITFTRTGTGTARIFTPQDDLSLRSSRDITLFAGTNGPGAVYIGWGDAENTPDSSNRVATIQDINDASLGLTLIQGTEWDDFQAFDGNPSIKISPVADNASILVQSDEQALLRYHVRDSNFDANGFDVTGLDSYTWHTSTSTSPDFIDVLGLRTFTVDNTSFYAVGDYVKVWDAEDDTRWYSGEITALVTDTSMTVYIDTLAAGADPEIETSLWKIYSATIVWAIGPTERTLPENYHYQMNGVMGFDGYYFVPSTTSLTITMQYTNPQFIETWPAEVQALDFVAEGITAYVNPPSIYSHFRARSNGAWIQNANWTETPTYSYDWHFTNNGSIHFPYQSSNARTGSGDALKFATSVDQAIIAGPEPTSSAPTAQRLVVAGADGFTDTTGEGGDIYLWAGRGGSTGGSGGDIKLDAGNGGGTAGYGGTVKMRGGYSTDASGGTVYIEAGDSYNSHGGAVNISAGSNSIDTESSGGSVTISGGYSGNAAGGGNVYLNTSQGGKVVITGHGGEFLNDSSIAANQIATIGDIDNTISTDKVRYSPTFTATGLTFTGSGATYPTYNSYYVKSGKMVSFVIEADLSTVTNFGTGQYKLQLPFTPAVGYNHFPGWAQVDVTVNPDVPNGHIILNVDHAGVTDVLDLHYLKQAGGANSGIIEGLFLQGTPVTLTTSSKIYINGTYISA